ncbi:MAG: ABC transporter ATP-binding protein [Frankia sp.]
MIKADVLTKRFGPAVAVDRLSFEVRPGRVTGFLGPNGAGKSTTIRMILGLDTPTGGRALVAGSHYRSLHRPLREVGSLLDAAAPHGGRTARDHLAWLAATNDIPSSRTSQVLERTGLTAVARKRIRGFSLGMKQRLGIAAALLGDPPVLILDEPVNGLDPEGIHWIRTLLRSMAGEGRTVLVSSHLMSEMALTADHLLVIGRGRLLADTSRADFLRTRGPRDVLLRTVRDDHLAVLLADRGATVTDEPDGRLSVTGLTADAISRLAAAHDIALSELTSRKDSLELAYLAITAGALDYSTAGSVTTPVLAPAADSGRHRHP